MQSLRPTRQTASKLRSPHAPKEMGRHRDPNLVLENARDAGQRHFLRRNCTGPSSEVVRSRTSRWSGWGSGVAFNVWDVRLWLRCWKVIDHDLELAC